MWKTLFVSIFFITSCKSLNIKTADRSGLNPPSGESSVDQTEILKNKVPDVYNIAVIVGPGGAKAMAASGVLKLLDTEDLNVKYVSGLGWGALPSAIYANNLKPHELEWQFYKLKQMPLRAKNFMGTAKDHLDRGKTESYIRQIFGTKKIQDFKLAFACPVRIQGAKATTIKLSGSASKSLMLCLDHPPLFQRAKHHSGAALAYGSLAEHFESKDINFIIYIDSLAGLTISDLSRVKLSTADRIYWEKLIRLNKHYTDHSNFSFTIDTKGYDLFEFSKAAGLIQQGSVSAKDQLKNLLKKLKQ